MPLWLEVGLSCEDFHSPPSAFGLNSDDPRVVRNINSALGVYHAARSRQDAKDKPKWDKEHPHGRKLLHYARSGETEHPDPMEVQVEIPQRPK